MVDHKIYVNVAWKITEVRVNNVWPDIWEINIIMCLGGGGGGGVRGILSLPSPFIDWLGMRLANYCTPNSCMLQSMHCLQP